MAGKDAVFLSPHKFVGGPGTPGVLVVKRALLRNRVPAVPGGGTVLFVTPDSHTYDPDPVIREEGGTPGDRRVDPRRPRVRAQGGRSAADEIRRREHDFARRALARGAPTRSIEILGNTRAERLPIVSLGLRHPPRLLHSNFVVARAQRPVRDPGAQRLLLRRPVPAPPVPGRRRLVGADARRDADAAQLGAKLGVRPARLQLLHQRGGVFEYILEAVHLLADHGLEAAAAVSLRPRQRPVAPPRSRRAAPASPGLRAALATPRPPRHCDRARERAGRSARSRRGESCAPSRRSRPPGPRATHRF